MRCTKRLRIELYQGGQKIPRDYPGYLIESLIYNVPNDRFGHVRRYDDMQSVLRFLWNGLHDENVYLQWTEPGELIMLFRVPQTAVLQTLCRWSTEAWDEIGGPT